MPLSPEILNWITAALGADAAVRSVHQMAGSTSSTLYAVELAQHGRTLDLVLRLFSIAWVIEEEPDLPAQEAAVLQKATAVDLPTPELVAVDETGAACGVPAVLMTRVPGTVDLRPADVDDWLRQMAEALPLIHAVEPGDLAWSYVAWADIDALQVPGWSRVPDLWARAIEIVQGPAPDYRPRFIHRDYHPNNILWQNGSLSGVVDWVTACRGPAGIDVGHCRLNLACVYGAGTAGRFLQLYEALTGVEQHPYWDLITLIEFLPEPELYDPWLQSGMTHLTPAILCQHLDDYLADILARL